jgi:hypothetical protein
MAFNSAKFEETAREVVTIGWDVVLKAVAMKQTNVHSALEEVCHDRCSKHAHARY